ncbi:two-component sensor histidine kinase [Chryseobacterium sp. RP-3-3]|uniref:Two-component sensor histidine kinase n=1 Tax=Chryseobacterium antibioticum TaxID=2728847 RepID=A0A7Y0FT45_9FLAO|nr:histidine kinase [Chryseobacterium antibioticum]NML71878.1 two-component sensor histidine kinase [Chryseobacterium antibioticum]
MKELPFEIKFIYVTAFILILVFAVFIIFVVLMYNKKQILYLKEKQLNIEQQNQLLQKELEKQKSIEHERERISHDMHDDLGAGISALKLQAEFLKQKAKDDNLQSDIDELLKTSEEMNLSMREMLWSLNSGNDTLGSFIDYAIQYADGFLKRTKIKLWSESIDVISDTSISTELRRNLFLCLKEAINNAYKHSHARSLKLSFSQEKNVFYMRISDDGLGISEGHSEGNGLRNMKRRMQEHNGECLILKEGPGTQILFRTTI